MSEGYVDPNFPNPGGPDDVPIIIYGYTPSFTLAVFASAYFAVLCIVHAYQTARYRSWYFVTLPIALLLEIVGYICRAMSAHTDPYRLIFFVLQYFFIVTAPVLLSAGIYAILSVLINRVGRRYAPLSPRWVLAIFITCDVVATVVQVCGAALIGARYSAKEDPTIGNNILLAGLSFQVLTFLVFIVLTSLFLYRCWKDKLIANDRAIRLFMASFLSATLLVYLRTCFRLAETAQGLKKDLSTHEIYFALLEFAPIAAAILLFALWHPGKHLGRSTT